MRKDVNTITVFINLVYRKPKVTQGDGHHLPEQQGGYLDKKGGYCQESELLLVPQYSAGRSGKSVTVSVHFPRTENKQSLTLKATRELSNGLKPPK